MKTVRSLFITILVFLLPTLLCAQETKIRFEAVDIYVDTGTQALAAYQIEFWVGNGGAKIVGIEGGTHPAFSEPPFHDPKAIQKERVIIAAFNTDTANNLPRGKTRVATIHLQLSGNKTPQYKIKLQTAATVQAKKISAEATFEIQDQ